MRKNSIAICGGAFGDEGKGRIIDEFTNSFAEERAVVVYRDNGGANAGHTIFHNGKRVALHQLLSGVFHKNATLILGKDMVLHPGDLVMEMHDVEIAAEGTIPATIMIDELATLSLDTHRAFENVLKQTQEGGKGSTGRGISPAYADVILRHPLKMRDIRDWDEAKIQKHYQLYEALISGLGGDLAQTEVPTVHGDTILVGTFAEFSKRLKEQVEIFKSCINDVHEFVATAWENEETAFLFEKAQAIGLDKRWGVYPDVTASDCTLDGIYSSTEGIVDPQLIETKAAVIKATYMSSVGSRILPSQMEETLANRIREDAHEYGATTKRPRGITYLDLPALRYFLRVGRVTHLVLTHMDIVYADTKIKVCTEYKKDGKNVVYRPDQMYLNTVTAEYIELETWDSQIAKKAKSRTELPQAAQAYLTFIEQQLGVPVIMITTGAAREEGIRF